MECVGTWQIEKWAGPAAEFHAMTLPPRRCLWAVTPERPALVLGSSQSMSVINMARAEEIGIDVVSRRSGGGAVWLDPAQTVWIDIVIPSSDSLWVDDVPRSMLWLGRAFAQILDDDTDVFDGRYEATDLARDYCFGGRAPGEVMRHGAKVVGISQRRTKDSARFQCVAYRSYDTDVVASLFLDPARAQSVRETTVGLVPDSLTDVVGALSRAIPG